MTVKQVQQACKKHKYILFRRFDGEVVGINGRIAKIARRLRRGAYLDTDETSFVSFRPCGLQEYISAKSPFIAA